MMCRLCCRKPGTSLWGSGKDSSKLRRSTSVIATSFCLWSLCGGNKAGLNYLIISELSEEEMKKFQSSDCRRGSRRPPQWVLSRAYLSRDHAQPCGRLPPDY